MLEVDQHDKVLQQPEQSEFGVYQRLRKPALFFYDENTVNSLSIEEKPTRFMQFQIDSEYEGTMFSHFGRISDKLSIPHGGSLLLASIASCEAFLDEQLEELQSQFPAVLEGLWQKEVESLSNKGFPDSRRYTFEETHCHCILSCDTCEGDGSVECRSCKGKGKNECGTCGGSCVISCTSCHGQGYNNCSSCFGLRTVIKSVQVEVSCTSCSGRGSIACSSCNGSGGKNVYNSQGLSSWQRCNSCSGGRTSCWGGCSGTGRKREYRNESVRCDSCSGSGVANCMRCSARGKVQCSNCRASGEVQCLSCSGLGIRTCSSCSGAGTHLYRGAVTCELSLASSAMIQLNSDQHDSELWSRASASFGTSGRSLIRNPYAIHRNLFASPFTTEVKLSTAFQIEFPVYSWSLFFMDREFPMSMLAGDEMHVFGEQSWAESVMITVCEYVDGISLEKDFTALGVGPTLYALSKSSTLFRSLFDERDFLNPEKEGNSICQKVLDQFNMSAELLPKITRMRQEIISYLPRLIRESSRFCESANFLLFAFLFFALMVLNLDQLVYIGNADIPIKGRLHVGYSLAMLQQTLREPFGTILQGAPMLTTRIQLWHVLFVTFLFSHVFVGYGLRFHYRWIFRNHMGFNQTDPVITASEPRMAWGQILVLAGFYGFMFGGILML